MRRRALQPVQVCMTDDMRETTMTARIARGSQSSYARFAGLMYLFTAFDITGVVIVSRIRGGGTFLAAAHSIAESETLYRIGLLCGLVGTCPPSCSPSAST